jgi:S-adenosylmethionine synthetase
MPLPIMLAHKICKRLAEVRKVGDLPYLRPDGKAQVTVRYEVDEHGIQRPVEIERILVSTQHADGCDAETLIKPDLIERVLRPILPGDLYDERRLEERDFVYVNPTGKFVLGGPMGDTGLTGRKIIVDTYGGAARHGGGAFSGKDPTKVDRSAAYAARYVAKNVVAAGLADRCEVNVAYAIGVAKPVSIAVQTFGTEADGISTQRIEELVREHFDLRPAAILRDLELQRPIYAKTAAYGHFGRDDHDFSWERTDKADALRAAAGAGAAAATA